MFGKNIQNSSPQLGVAIFIQKTYDMLQNNAYSQIIHWLSSGKEFIIVNIETFQEEILPAYFRHRNINSFIRQLNMYGFHKSRKDPSKSIFSNPSFMRGRPDLLPYVKRKTKTDQKKEEKQSISYALQNSRTSPEKKCPEGVQVQEKNETEIVSSWKVENNHIQSETKIICHKNDNILPKSEENLNIFECINMIYPSKVMEENPAVYSNLNANQEQQCLLGEEQDNISIEDEIEKERKVFQNRYSGVSLLNTKNLLKSSNLLN